MTHGSSEMTEAELDAIERYAKLTWAKDPHGEGNVPPDWNPDALRLLIAAARQGIAAREALKEIAEHHNQGWQAKRAREALTPTPQAGARSSTVEPPPHERGVTGSNPVEPTTPQAGERDIWGNTFRTNDGWCDSQGYYDPPQRHTVTASPSPEEDEIIGSSTEGRASCEGYRDAERIGARGAQEAGSTDEAATPQQAIPRAGTQALPPDRMYKNVQECTNPTEPPSPEEELTERDDSYILPPKERKTYRAVTPTEPPSDDVAPDMSRREGVKCEPSGVGLDSRCNGLQPQDDVERIKQLEQTLGEIAKCRPETSADAMRECARRRLAPQEEPDFAYMNEAARQIEAEAIARADPQDDIALLVERLQQSILGDVCDEIPQELFDRIVDDRYDAAAALVRMQAELERAILSARCITLRNS